MDELIYEKELFEKGFPLVAGVDEVGRGPLAGSVVAAAVILPLEEEKRILGIDDSKKLSKKKREYLAEKIKEVAVAYAIEEVGEGTIDEINILQATRLAMKRAIERLSPRPDFVLTDGNMTLDISVPQKSIVKGDAKVASIGEHNAGYGTKAHVEAIREMGICEIHRKTFVKKFWDGTRKSRPQNT